MKSDSRNSVELDSISDKSVLEEPLSISTRGEISEKLFVSNGQPNNDNTEADASFHSEICDELHESKSFGLNIPTIPDAVFLAPDVMDFPKQRNYNQLQIFLNYFEKYSELVQNEIK